METQVGALANAVMNAVVKSGVVHNGNIDRASEVMKSEVKAFLWDQRYAAVRECAMNRSIHDGYIVSLIVAECVSQILN